MKSHWSDRLACQCGKAFRSYAAEAYHRHNFPLLCRPARVRVTPRKKAVDKSQGKPR